MRVLVTGASGLLGRGIVKHLRTLEGWHVVGTAYSRMGEGLVRVDLKNADEIRALVDTHKPDMVIHAAAERRPDVSRKDPEGTQKLNVESVGTLAAACARAGAWMLYISTDYVFDGESPPYRVDSEPNPLSTYGRSKLAGEHELLRVMPDGGVLRVPVMYGPVERVDESAITVLFKQLCHKNACASDDWASRNPTHVHDIAQVCAFLCKQRAKTPDKIRGVFHWRAKDRVTKYSLSVRLAERFGVSSAHIAANPNPPDGAPRPRDAEMDRSRVEALLQEAGETVHETPLDDGLHACLLPFAGELAK